METKVYFNDLQERSQRVLISQELASQNNGTMPAVNNLTIGPNPYADDPDCQLITADTEIGTWLLVWSATDKEFNTKKTRNNMEKQNLDRALWLRENINMFQSDKDEFVFRKQNKKLCGISLHFENPDNPKEIRQTTYLTNPSEPLTAAIYTAVEKEYDRYLNELKEEYDKIF